MDALKMLYIILIVAGVSTQDVIKKDYDHRIGSRDVFTFSAVTVLAACLFFLIRSGFRFDLELSVLPYAFGFAAGYCVATVFNFLAIQCGPLSLTSLTISYSLLIPTVYGLVFDGDDAGAFFYIGLVLLVASLALINGQKGQVRVTLKWAVCAMLALIGNGACSTVQTVQQRVFRQQYQNEFMIVALLCVAAVLIAYALLKEKKTAVSSLKKGVLPMVLCGAANGFVNLLVMVASAQMNKSVLFPLISAGGIVLTWLISAIIYREKLSVRQNIGMFLGVLSIVLFNL